MICLSTACPMFTYPSHVKQPRGIARGFTKPRHLYKQPRPGISEALSLERNRASQATTYLVLRPVVNNLPPWLWRGWLSVAFEIYVSVADCAHKPHKEKGGADSSP